MVDEYLVVKTAVADIETARAIARHVLSQKLAASVQLVGPIESHYWWRGELCSATEYLCLCTTTGARYAQLETAILDLHPYITPEISARPIARGHQGFLSWISDSTAGPSAPDKAPNRAADRTTGARLAPGDAPASAPPRALLETHGSSTDHSRAPQGSTHEMRILGTSNIEISPIIMGAWQAGGQYWVGIDDNESIRALRTAVDHGINAFDTAEEYGDGHSERIVGQALRETRDQVVLMTKVWSTNLHPEKVIEACHRSLKNLQTDRIDLYQIHWPSGCWGSDPVPIEDTMGAMVKLLEQGKIRAIGVSNFTLELLEHVNNITHIDALQPAYSLFWRHIDKDIRTFCVDEDISVLAYSPLAQGLLTGRFEPGHRFGPDDPRSDNKLFAPEHAGRVQKALAQLGLMAEARGCTMAQLVLAWTITQSRTCAVVGARSADQVKDNAGAMAIELSPEELDAIDLIGRPVAAPFLDDPMLWTWQP